MPSPSGWAEVPCAQCGRRVAGLEWNALCPDCSRDRQRRANRLASRISLAATALTGAYVYWRVPNQPLARTYGVIAILATYIIVRRIVQRLGMEFLPR